LRKPTEPLSDAFSHETRIQLIDSLPTPFLQVYQASLEKDAKVSSGGGPAASEALGNLARAHASSAKVQDQQDFPA